MYASISEHQSVNIRQISQNRAEQVAYYRYLENQNVTLPELVRSVSDHCQQQVSGIHALALSDSSEVNLQAHAGRLKKEGLGVVGAGGDESYRVMRGGSWDRDPGYCRSAYRSRNNPVNCSAQVGFRVVCASPRTP